MDAFIACWDAKMYYDFAGLMLWYIIILKTKISKGGAARKKAGLK